MYLLNKVIQCKILNSIFIRNLLHSCNFALANKAKRIKKDCFACKYFSHQIVIDIIMNIIAKTQQRQYHLKFENRLSTICVIVVVASSPHHSSRCGA